VKGLTLDAGALEAFERKDRRTVAPLRTAIDHRIGLAVPAGVVAQVWRGGRTQARLARLLGAPAVEAEPLDDVRAATTASVPCWRRRRLGVG
jgi:hypothetical protein